MSDKTREEAAKEAYHDGWGHRQGIVEALAAADAWDAAHGVHRISLDAATIERAARAIAGPVWWDMPDSMFPPDELPGAVREKERARHRARKALAAAVKAGQ